MSTSYTITETLTFAVTHARHIAAKVATDLKRMQSFYGDPNDAWIAGYEAEVSAMLRHGFLGTVAYGFKRYDQWIEPTLKYSARDLAGASANDDDPGRVRPCANIDGATFYSYMTYSSAWYQLTPAQREQFKESLPFQRGGADEPTVNGYLAPDRSYSAGGRSLQRASVRSY